MVDHGGNVMTAAAAGAEGSMEERLSELLSSESSEEFSVAAYLNLALAGASGEEELQAQMTELALQLQLQTQSCHDEIGRIGAELRAILPRCAADVGRLGVGLDGMRLDAESLLQASKDPNIHNKSRSVAETEPSSSSSLSTPPPMETLSTLHALRSSLTATKGILEAAASWDSTIASIPGLLSGSSSSTHLAQAVQALGRLEAGAKALKGMPGKEERTEAIAKIRTQVEVLLKPQLLQALQKMDTRLGPLQQCVSMYRQLDKLDALQEEYVKQRPSPIHKLWFSFSSTTTTSSSETEPFPTEHPNATTETKSSEPTSTTDPNTFITWLPGWYDSVLALLTEERRRSASVFGGAVASQVIAKVLKECFRPILASFSSRLAAICSPTGDGSGSGSLESIGSAYESTLQFLSLAYEQMAGLESSSSSNASGGGGATSGNTSATFAQLQTDMESVLVLVASPFASYQTNFCKLELSHSSETQRMVARDVRGAVSGKQVGATLSSLQDCMDRLGDLAPFMFPLAQGAVDRFELFNCGHRPSEAMATVDALLSKHVQELAMSVGTLSATMTSDGDQLAANFDEQHVQCALEVLRMAGSFRRDLQAFERKTRERIGGLVGRMASSMAQEKAIAEATSSTRNKSDGCFILPDSLSPVEVEYLLARTVCGGSNNSFKVLQRLAASEADGAIVIVPLFPESMEATARLTSSCHSFVFDVCSAVPRHSLEGMSVMPVWKQGSGFFGGGESYGVLPQQYMTTVGEHMLSLVQALEPFASSPEALSLANEVMGGVKDVALQPWRDFLASTGYAPGSESTRKEVVDTLMRGKELAEYVVKESNNSFDDEEEDVEEEEELDEAEKASAAFCNQWLDVLGSAVTGRLLERSLRIQHLTTK
eukprot:scaffold9365_cov51-Attheya_sp.AAC.6